MNTSTSEYLPQNGNGNGDGQAHKKIFTLAPAPDDDTRRILEARWRVCTHAQVEDGAARMFVLLQDGSLNPQLNFGRRGVISVSQPVLCQWLACGERSVRTYMKQLVHIGEIWIRYKSLPHGARIIEYFLTCLRPQDEFEFARSLNDQQLWGRAGRKTRFKNDARGEHGRFTSPTRPVLPVASEAEESTETSQNAASEGRFLPPLPANIAADGGNPLPLTAANIAAVHGNPLPPSAATVAAVSGNICREQRQNRPGLRETEIGEGDTFKTGGGPTPPDLAIEEAIKDGDGAFPDWCASWDGAFRGKMEKELGRIQVRLQTSPSAFWKRRADFLRTKLDGGKAPAVKRSPAPARAVTAKPAPMPIEERRALAAKYKLSPAAVAAGA